MANDEWLQELEKSKLLLVEGRDELNFFTALLRHLERLDIEVSTYDGRDNLRSFLRGLTELPDFENVDSIGIVRDADDDANAAFQSVCSSLSNANLPVPNALLVPASGQPQVAVMIMPPDANEGMLENLCLLAVGNDPAMPCVDQYFRCLESQMGTLPQNEAKARVHAFLASRESSDLRLGEAALRGYLPWDSSPFNPVKQFLNKL